MAHHAQVCSKLKWVACTFSHRQQFRNARKIQSRGRQTALAGQSTMNLNTKLMEQNQQFWKELKMISLRTPTAIIATILLFTFATASAEPAQGFGPTLIRADSTEK